MGDYVLSCCSTADLTDEHFRSRDINYICFHFELDGVSYMDDLGKSVPFDEFYKKLSEGSETKTSQANADEFERYFEPYLQAGQDIIHVCLSSGLSGVVNSAMIAKNNLEKRYPNRRIALIDSLGASSGYGLIMNTLADLRDQGYDFEELVDWTEAHKLNMHHWFFSTDLSFYIKGGRIPKAAGFIGCVLNICPFLNMDGAGRLTLREKIRTKRKVIKAMAAAMEEHAQDGLDYSGHCYISNSGCYEDARAVADLIESKFTKLAGPVEIYTVGTTIGSHTGPGTVALFFWGDSREEKE